MPHVFLCGYVWLENVFRLLLENKHFRLCGDVRPGTRPASRPPAPVVLDEPADMYRASCFACFLRASRCGERHCHERTDYPLTVCLLAAVRLVYWCIIHVEHAMLVEPFSDKNFAEFVCDLLLSSALIVVMSQACNTKAVLWLLIQGFVVVVSVALNADTLERLPGGDAAPLPSNPGYWARWLVQPAVHVLFLCLGMCLSHVCCERTRNGRRAESREVVERFNTGGEDARGLWLVRREQLLGRIWFRVLVLCLDLICVLRCVDILYVLNSDAMHAGLDVFLSALLLMVHFQKKTSSTNVYRQYVDQESEESIDLAETGSIKPRRAEHKDARLAEGG